jgi:hypothetical protein
MKATEREKALIFAMAAGGVEGWKEAFILSRETADPVSKKAGNLSSIVSRWKQRPDIVKAYENAIKILQDRDEKNRQAGRMEAQEERQQEDETGTQDNNRTQKRKTARIDYSDPKAQTDKLNELINTADDPGEALDALKVIISTQKADREAARSQKSVIYYRPIRCKQCKLYQKAGEKARKA